jgi:ABC-type multidrug transport system fused ATPase/permease subunit
MSRRPTFMLWGAGLLLLAVGLGAGFALGVTAQSIGFRMPLFAVIAALLLVFVVGILLTLYRFMESYRELVRSLQAPVRSTEIPAAMQQSTHDSLASAAELVRVLQEFEAQVTALQRFTADDAAITPRSASASVTPPESIQNKDRL